MRQVLENLRTGKIELADVPCPDVRPGCLLIRSRASLLSAGTERMLLEFGRAGPIKKARREPERVRQVLDKIRTDGLTTTIRAIRRKLDQPIPLGYSNAGTVLEVGGNVTDVEVGDRVVSNGHHAEVVLVPRNLCAKVPDDVSDEAASFAVVAAIALQGVRLAVPTLGESFAVTGLGLVGLLAVQILRANGCRVLGIDVDSARLELARGFGAETVDLSSGADAVAAGRAFSRGRGMDGVIICASAKGSGPIRDAAQMCRKRGRIILVGVVDLELSRADFYEKELTFQVSCSYGPGRYDPEYEERGRDYPFGFVRWTVARNLEAVLDMMASGSLDVTPLITHRFPFESALEAYELLGSREPSIGIVLQYPRVEGQPDSGLRARAVRLRGPRERRRGAAPVVGFIGAGNYATGILIPAFERAGAELRVIASSGGASALHAGRKFGFREATTDVGRVLSDPEISTVVIVTRHDSHADLVCRALEAGKHVFVEKPLAVTKEGLARIERTIAGMENVPLLMVGFNRRFAPHVRRAATLLASVSEPKVIVMTVNAGEIAPDHWTQDRDVGGGRIVGEACHFVDLMRFLVGAAVTSIQAQAIGSAPGVLVREDKCTFTLGFADGSFGTVHYLANGHPSFPKERIEIFCAGRILRLDNFIRLRGYGWPRLRASRLLRQDKGQQACAAAFLEAVRSGAGSPIPIEEILEVSRVTLAVRDEVSMVVEHQGSAGESRAHVPDRSIS